MHELLVAIHGKYAPLEGYSVVENAQRTSNQPTSEGTLTAARLRSLLFYDPSTGIFTWRVDRVRVLAGDRAGRRTKDGYIRIGIGGKRYQAHRLAFLYMTGSIPDELIDHENLNPSDNRWKNLRAATNSQNQMNTDMKSNNTSGFKGVSWHKNEKKWRADIWVGGRKIFLGYASSLDAACELYRSAANSGHKEFARH